MSTITITFTLDLITKMGFFPLPQAYRVSLETVQSGPSCSIDGVQNTNEMNAVHTELVVRCLH